MKKKNIRRILVILFLIVFAIITYIDTRANYLEYKELGENYVSVFYTNIKYKYYVMGINFIILYTIMYFTNRGIKKGLQTFFNEEKKEMPKLPNKSLSLIISTITSLAVSIIFTPKIMLYASNVSFNEVDPIFNLDISFYMFVEPLVKMLVLYAIGIIIGLVIYTTVYYIIVFNKYFDGIDKETLKNSRLMKSIMKYTRFFAICFSLFTLIKTFDILFDNFLTTDSGIDIVGAGIVDVRIKIWANILLSVIIVFAIFKATLDWKKQITSKIVKDILIIPAYLVLMFITMFGFDAIFINSNEYDRERNYIENNIYNTTSAYGISCEGETIQYSGTINENEINENKSIIQNTVFLDKQTVLQNLKETQTETGYYVYDDASLSQYDIDGKKEVVYVSPREILNNKRAYNSKTYEYTHGHGLILISATSLSEDGNIKYIQKDIKTPQIYYGLETNNIAITTENSQIEFDYTDNKGVEHTTFYQGNSGLKLNWIDRLTLGVKKGNIKLALSGDVTKNSKILINRNIIERATKVLPNVIYDTQPYTVVDENGQIYWVLDAYTKSKSYPYSTYTNIEHNGEKEKINYIRNSIKIIINAYDGTMKFYITDRTDPIAMAYRNIYPEIFQPLDSEIPSSISEHFIYPKFLYDIQATMIQEYHNTKPDLLYRSDDSWRKATYNTVQNNKSSGSELQAYYTMIKHENEDTVGLIQMFTPNEKQNLTSYLVGTVSNGQNKLKLYKMSSDTAILGPTQLDTQIAQDENIQSEVDSLTVTGAKVTKNMIIVPIQNTLLYVEPIYQTMINESDIPVLKKIIVASGNKVAIGNDFREALKNLASQSATSINTYTTEDIDGLIKSIIDSNNNLSSSINSNDWELMGADIKRLQELIKSLEKQIEKENIVQNNVSE